jgi:hypothetical protein
MEMDAGHLRTSSLYRDDPAMKTAAIEIFVFFIPGGIPFLGKVVYCCCWRSVYISKTQDTQFVHEHKQLSDTTVYHRDDYYERFLFLASRKKRSVENDVSRVVCLCVYNLSVTFIYFVLISIRNLHSGRLRKSNQMKKKKRKTFFSPRDGRRKKWNKRLERFT